MDVLANQPATDNRAIALRFYELFDTKDVTLIERVLATDWKVLIISPSNGLKNFVAEIGTPSDPNSTVVTSTDAV